MGDNTTGAAEILTELIKNHTGLIRRGNDPHGYDNFASGYCLAIEQMTKAVHGFTIEEARRFIDILTKDV
jgi:hypothetical protein